MRKFATLVAASLAAVMAASPASAAGYYNNIVDNVGGDFGNTDPTKYPPLFNDIYTFSSDFARNATVEIVSTMTVGDFSTNVNFVGNGVKLNAKLIPATNTGVFERRYLANFRIPAGVHQIVVKGSAGENGQYSGILTLAGVPEPSTWALMILGFGLTGAAMRRRTVKAKVSFA